MTGCLPIPRDLSRRRRSGLFAAAWKLRGKRRSSSPASEDVTPVARVACVVRRLGLPPGRRTPMHAAIEKYVQHVDPFYDPTGPPPPPALDLTV